ncbi:MAG: secretin N-terminal domain-containing protein [Planctomycetota bacterium]
MFIILGAMVEKNKLREMKIFFLLVAIFVFNLIVFNQDENVKVSWFGVDLELVVQEVSEQANLRILYDPQILQGKQVYLISTEGIPKKALFSVLESICESFGLSIINMGPEDVPIYKIVKTEIVQKKPTPLYEEKEVAREKLGEKLITQITVLKHIASQDVLGIVQAMVSNSAGVVSIPDSKIIVITDYALNVRKISRILKLLDRPKPKIHIKVVKVKYASVEDLEKKLTSVIEEPGLIRKEGEQQTGRATRFKVIADARTNSFIITGTKVQIARIEKVIRKLDLKIPKEEKIYRFIRLRNQQAKKVGEYLNTLIKGIPTLISTEEVKAGTREQKEARPGEQQSKVGEQTSIFTGSKEEDIVVIPIEETNSIMLVGKEKWVSKLEKIIEAIDIRRPQVYIEAAIVEITATDDFDLGTELASTHIPGSGTTYFAGTAFGLSQFKDNDNDGLPDVKIPIGSPMGGGVVGLVKGGQGKIPLLISMLKKKVALNVISTPQITTNDNEEASLTITDEFPTTTVQTTTINPITSFGGFQKAESLLKIKPHISEGSHLILEITQKIERFVGQQTNPAIPPPKTGREIKTVLTAPNESTVILGGIVVRSLDTTVTGVPGFMDIPLLGNLFKRTQKKRINTTLYVFLTTSILESASFTNYLEITRTKYKEIEHELKEKWKVPFRIVEEGTNEGLNFFDYKSPFQK